MHRRARLPLALALAATSLAACSSSSAPAEAVPSLQPWAHVPGPCPPQVEGAVFSRSADGCGGTGTAFDSFQIYLPALVADEATAGAPCAGVAEGDRCLRMWYVGNDDDEARRIGLATSPDGVRWTRVPGEAAGGALLDPGPGFDGGGLSAPTVVKDGDTYKMWYTGLGPKDQIQGVGLATSADGRRWTRVTGPAEGGAVLRESGRDGDFDRDEIIIAQVLKDVTTAAAPCSGAATGSACYRMWYEGIDTEEYYRYRIGYATSPDGVTWTKVRGDDPSGAVLGLGRDGTFDDTGVGAPFVVRDGALYRMWYEAFDGKRFSIGYATSTDGVRWTRPAGEQPAFQGADDPGTYDDDSVWTATVLKDAATYRMWYTVSAKPDSQRFGLAELTPGRELADLRVAAAGDAVEVSFTTSEAVPAGGSLLVDLGPGVAPGEVTLGSGFDAGAAAAVEAALTDASAAGVARPVVVVRMSQAVPAGPKRLVVTAGTPGPLEVTVQTFGTSEVLEHGTTTTA